MQKFRFNKKSPRHTSINRLLEEWKEITAIEKDVHVGIVGGEGDGKSHMMINFIDKMPFTNLWDNVVYTGNKQEFYDKADKLRERSILGLDESLDLASRQTSTQRDVREYIEYMRGVIRKEKKPIVLHLGQLFRDFHGYFRNHRIMYWIQLPHREWFKKEIIATVLRKTGTPVHTGKRDVWLLDILEMQWFESVKEEGRPLVGSKYLDELRRNPFYIGNLTFDKMSQKLEEEYNRCRRRAYKKYGLIEGIIEKPDKNKIIHEHNMLLIERMLKRDIMVKDITAILGISKQTYYNWKEREKSRIQKSTENEVIY